MECRATDTTKDSSPLLRSGMFPWVLALLALHALLVVELPTDFLEVDRAALEASSGYSAWLDLTGGLARRRVVELAVHQGACLALLIGLLRLGTGRGAAVVALGACLLSPALTGDVVRRVQPVGLGTSVLVLAAALVLIALSARKGRVSWFAGALIALVVGTALVRSGSADPPLDEPSWDAVTLRSDWMRPSDRVPRIDIDETERDRFEQVLGEPLMRDRVRLPDAAAFLEGLRRCASVLGYGAPFAALLVLVLRTVSSPRDALTGPYRGGLVMLGASLWALGSARTGGGSWTGLVPVAALLSVWYVVALQPPWRVAAPRGVRRTIAALGWLALAGVVLPNFVDLEGSAFVGRRILPAGDETYRVETGGREHFVGTNDRALELHFPRAIGLVGRELVVDVTVVDPAIRQVAVKVRGDGLEVAQSFDVASSPPPWRLEPTGITAVTSIAVSDAADPSRVVWRSLEIR